MKTGFSMIFLLVSLSLFSKPRIIDLVKELKNANFIGLVEIQEYYADKDSILSDVKVDSAKYIRKIKLRAITNDSILYVTTYKSEYLYPLFGYIADHGDGTLTGTWPKQTDTVLVILDNLNNISLFGNKVNDTFLLWSPYLTESLASFRFKESTELLCYNCEDCSDIPVKRKSCRDKCLLSSKAIPVKFSKFVIPLKL